MFLAQLAPFNILVAAIRRANTPISIDNDLEAFDNFDESINDKAAIDPAKIPIATVKIIRVDVHFLAK